MRYIHSMKYYSAIKRTKYVTYSKVDATRD